MKHTEVPCCYCGKIIDFFDEIVKIETQTKPAENITNCIEEYKTILIKQCPHCNRPNELYYALMTEFFVRKGKKCYMGIQACGFAKIDACVYNCSDCEERRKRN